MKSLIMFSLFLCWMGMLVGINSHLLVFDGSTLWYARVKTSPGESKWFATLIRDYGNSSDMSTWIMNGSLKFDISISILLSTDKLEHIYSPSGPRHTSCHLHAQYPATWHPWEGHAGQSSHSPASHLPHHCSSSGTGGTPSWTSGGKTRPLTGYT